MSLRAGQRSPCGSSAERIQTRPPSISVWTRRNTFEPAHRRGGGGAADSARKECLYSGCLSAGASGGSACFGTGRASGFLSTGAGATMDGALSPPWQPSPYSQQAPSPQHELQPSHKSQVWKQPTMLANRTGRIDRIRMRRMASLPFKTRRRGIQPQRQCRANQMSARLDRR